MAVVLRSLTIEGFKSFADPTTISFTCPVVAIVGPNGSGKSNIADALQFVLGEQAFKTLRGSRGEDLIFHGGVGRRKLSRARVEAMFDNRHNTFPLEVEEVHIAREVYRDGSGVYEINGARVRRKDVVHLLAHAHIGPSGYHLVRQGEGDRLLSLSPEELRLVLEDALGLRVYHVQRADAHRQLAEARHALSIAEARRAELRPQLDALEARLVRAREAEEVAQALRSAWCRYAAAQREALAMRATQLRERETALAAAQEALKRDPHRREYAEEVDALHSLQRTVVALEDEQRQAAREVRRLEQTLARLEGARAALAEKEKGSIRVPLVALVRLSKLLRAAQNALAKHPLDLEGAQKQLGDASRLVSSLHEMSSAGSHQPNAVMKQAEEAQELLARARAALQDIEARLKEAQQKLHQEELKAYEVRAAQREAEARWNLLAREEAMLSREREWLRDQEAQFRQDAREIATLLRDPSLLEHTQPPDKGDADASLDDTARMRLRREIERLTVRYEELRGLVSKDDEEMANELRKRLASLDREVRDLQTALARLEALERTIHNALSQKFAQGIAQASAAFNQMVRAAFGAGEGVLRMVHGVGNSLPASDERMGGVVVDVRIPSCRIRHLGMLSGGERALVSIALVFALASLSPPPFLVLDEVDAALDEANSVRFGALIGAVARTTQLIIITHNRETMRQAGMLYGVVRGSDGASRLLRVTLEKAQEQAAR